MQKKTWKSIIRHALTGVLAAVLALHTMAVPSLTAFAAAGDPVSYLDANGTKQTCSSYTDLASTTTSWSAGWYVVEGTVTISSRITVKGKAHLILADGATLTATKGITVSANGNGDLTIYAQSTGSDQGKLIASAADDYTAAIGGEGKRKKARSANQRAKRARESVSRKRETGGTCSSWQGIFSHCSAP